MKVDGVVINSEKKKDMLKIYPSATGTLDGSYFELDDASYDIVEEEINKRIDKLSSQTDKYMTGQDDGKWYLFSDDPTTLNIIQSLFPGLDIRQVESNRYPMDYDYHRDLS